MCSSEGSVKANPSKQSDFSPGLPNERSSREQAIKAVDLPSTLLILKSQLYEVIIIHNVFWSDANWPICEH